jgi:hypothetical protein
MATQFNPNGQGTGLCDAMKKQSELAAQNMAIQMQQQQGQ